MLNNKTAVSFLDGEDLGLRSTNHALLITTVGNDTTVIKGKMQQLGVQRKMNDISQLRPSLRGGSRCRHIPV